MQINWITWIPVCSIKCVCNTSSIYNKKNDRKWGRESNKFKNPNLSLAF